MDVQSLIDLETPAQSRYSWNSLDDFSNLQQTSISNTNFPSYFSYVSGYGPPLAAKMKYLKSNSNTSKPKSLKKPKIIAQVEKRVSEVHLFLL